MIEDERRNLHEQAQDIALSATVLTGLHRELPTNNEWDEFVAQVGREVYELLVQRVEQRRDELEARAVNARLTRMLVTVIDANYGTSYHHIGDDDGIPEGQAKEIQEWWQAHLQQVQDDYNRKQAEHATVEQGEGA